MQTVSKSWKDVHKQTLLNESFVEVSLDIGDPEAIARASATDNGSVYISNTPDVVSEVDKEVIPYGTLEQNMWILDGFITGERLKDSRSPQEFVGYGIKEASTLFFMY